MAWVVKLLGGPNVWGRQIRRMTGASAVHRELRFFVFVESLHFPQLGDGMFFSGKSRSPLFEALGLRSSVLLRLSSCLAAGCIC